MIKQWLKWGIPAVIVFLGAIQLVPYGHSHINPPVVAEPVWDSQTTRNLAVRACYDCHSNETVWLWYTNVAPVSWVIQSHVDSGRRRLNFSDMNSRGETGDMIETIREGSMPLWDYMLFHPAARLSASEKTALINGLQATFPGSSFN